MKRQPIVDFLRCTVAVFSIFSHALATDTDYFFDPSSCTDLADRFNIDVQIQRAVSIARHLKYAMDDTSADYVDYVDPFLGAQSSSSNKDTASAIFDGGETWVNNRRLPSRIEGIASYHRGQDLSSNIGMGGIRTAGNLVQIRVV